MITQTDATPTGLPTLASARANIWKFIRSEAPVRLDPNQENYTSAKYEEHFVQEYKVPLAYLEAWQTMALAYHDAKGALANWTAEEKANLRAERYSLLLAWLQMAADNKDIKTAEVTVADAVGSMIVQSAIYVDDRDGRQANHVINAWGYTVPHAWIYEAAGFSPDEVGTAASLPDADGLRLLAGLRGITLPDPLPID